MAMAVLTLAACHRDRGRQTEDSIAEVPSPAAVDTISTQPATGDTATKPEPAGRQLQQDSAETVNLRLFTRKQQTIYTPDMLIGEWVRGNEHEQYTTDNGGRRWDTDDDVASAEAQMFSWTMDSNLLTFKYRMALGGLMVRQYVVTFVDDETLVYRDVHGDSYMWDKVPSGMTDRP